MPRKHSAISPRFGSGLIPIAVRRKLWHHVGPQLLHEAAEDPDDGFVFFQLRDTIDMAAELGRLGEVGVVPSMAALVQLHDRLREDYETRAQRNLQAVRRREAQPREEATPPLLAQPIPAPPGPTPGERALREPPPAPPGFAPLRTPQELREEGREMKHCVGSYRRRVERGECFLYRVLQPERATLAVRWSKTRSVWSVDQLRGFQNARVRPETALLARDWLETGAIDPEAARWAREQVRRRFRDIVERLELTSDTDERKRLKKKLARLRFGG
jgi:hypothetical protein